MDFPLKKAIFILLISLSLSLFSQDRYAIVIGNSDYTSISDLPIVKNDTIDVSRKFKELGYMVSTLADPSKEDIQGYFSSLKYTITKDSTVILYYAGHGVQIDSRDYIITKDITADINTLEDNSVAVSWLMGNLYNSKASTILMFIDACRNNPFPSKSGERGIKVVTKDVKKKEDGSRKRLGIIYSTNSGDTAYDSVKGFKNSPFTTAFLNNISIPNENFKTVLEKISLDVGLYTKGTQAIDSKVDFKEDLVLNTNNNQKVSIRESYNSLIVKGYGILRVIANDKCMVTINNASEFFFDKGQEKSFDYEVGKHSVKLTGENKTEELKVSIKEASTTQLFFNDYNGGGDYNQEVEFVKFDKPKEGEPVIRDIALVSDFRNHGLDIPFGGKWSVISDKVNGGATKATFDSKLLNDGVLRMDYRLAGNGSLGYRYAQIEGLLDKDTDYSNYSSVEIKVRGKGKDFHFALKSSNIKDNTYLQSKKYKVGNEWQTYSIEIDKLKVPLWSKKVKLNPSSINQMFIVIEADRATEKNFIEIEYIKFIDSKTVKNGNNYEANDKLQVSDFKNLGLEIPFGGEWGTETDKYHKGSSTAYIEKEYLKKGIFRVNYKLQHNSLINFRYAQGEAIFDNPIDITGYTAIELKARGEGQKLILGLASPTKTTEIIYYSDKYKTNREWTTYTVPIKSFKRPNWVQGILDKESIIELFIETRSDTKTDNMFFELEYVRFISNNVNSNSQRSPLASNTLEISNFKKVGLEVPLGGKWGVVSDIGRGGGSTASIDESLLKDGILRMNYKLENNSSLGYRYADLQAYFDDLQDLTSYSSVEVRVRGKGNRFYISLVSPKISEGGFHQSKLYKVKNNWTTYTIPITKLKRPNWAKQSKLNLGEIEGLNISIDGKRATKDSFIEVDYIKLIK